MRGRCGFSRITPGPPRASSLHDRSDRVPGPESRWGHMFRGRCRASAHRLGFPSLLALTLCNVLPKRSGRPCPLLFNDEKVGDVLQNSAELPVPGDPGQDNLLFTPREPLECGQEHLSRGLPNRHELSPSLRIAFGRPDRPNQKHSISGIVEVQPRAVEWGSGRELAGGSWQRAAQGESWQLGNQAIWQFGEKSRGGGLAIGQLGNLAIGQPGTPDCPAIGGIAGSPDCLLVACLAPWRLKDFGSG